MAGTANDALALPRRALPWLTILAVIAASPNLREAVLSFLRRLLNSLRSASLGVPAVRKDFLGAGLQQGRLGAARSSPSSRAGALRDEQTAAPRRTAPPADCKGSFGDFDQVLPAWLSEGLHRCDFHSLKPIQREILPLALAGKDVCGIAPTGSGKTLAFLVPGLVHAGGQPALRGATDGPIMLVLAPTRELAVQIGKVAEGLLKPSFDPKYQLAGGLNSTVIYGGPRRTDQLQTLRFQQRTHLIVATPGRLLDFLEHGAFTLHRVSFFVLDEGDRMLDFGFEPDVTTIAQQIRKDRQMLFFSATWPKEVEEAAMKLTSNGQPFETVSVNPAQAEIQGDGSDGGGPRLSLPGHGGLAVPPKEIHQVVEVMDGGNQFGSWNTRGDFEHKAPKLLKYLEDALGGIGETPGKALIFVATRIAAEELGHLVARHFGLDRCGVMHGARKQDQREATLHAFRTGRLRALVATDVLGRGVDIPGVTHVVIYDFPGDIETYIHRVGRTGRNGESGTSIAFFEPRHWQPELARELVDVLKVCKQDVPEALEREAGNSVSQIGTSDWGEGWFSGQASTSTSQEPKWEVDEAQVWRKGPELENDSPGLATAEELGEWHCGGVRAWGYSANGGQSEQGRMELRAGGKLRTTWGWGEWALLPSAPHCAPPRRACPTPGGQPTPTVEAEQVKEVVPASTKSGGAPHLSLSWGGCTDVVALDDDAQGFELVTRSGRPAHTYKKKTLGRALPGVSL